MPQSQIGDGNPDGAVLNQPLAVNGAVTASSLTVSGATSLATSTTNVGFYGTAPVAQRASNTLHYTSVVSAYTATSASALIGSWIVEVTNTLTGLGLWV